MLTTIVPFEHTLTLWCGKCADRCNKELLAPLLIEVIALGAFIGQLSLYS